jgi:putative membrane protein
VTLSWKGLSVGRFLVSWGVGALSLFLVSLILGSHMEFASFWAVIWTTLLFGLLNAILGKIVNFLTCPVYLLTLGLSRFLVGGAFLLLVGSMVPGFVMRGFLWAVLAALLASIVNTFISSVIRDGDKQ